MPDYKIFDTKGADNPDHSTSAECRDLVTFQQRKMSCTITFSLRVLLIFSVFLALSTCTKDKKTDTNEKDKWKKKNIRDYNDADMERLYDEWEVKLSHNFATCQLSIFK